jgi:CheY-like chemotaxis protein
VAKCPIHTLVAADRFVQCIRHPDSGLMRGGLTGRTMSTAITPLTSSGSRTLPLADAETISNQNDPWATPHKASSVFTVGGSDTKVQWTALIKWRIVYVMEPSKAGSGSDHPLVAVVDDDESMRESLPDLLGEFGFAARTFSSPENFLSSDCLDRASCLILDIAMPGMSGPELYQELKRRGYRIPVVFITGQTDETIRDRVLKQGAAGFLLKPFSDVALLAALKMALQGT